MPVPPQFLPGYKKSAAPASAPTKGAMPMKSKMPPAEKPGQPDAEPANQPETPSQRAENARVLQKILADNGVSQKVANNIMLQFKAQDN